MRSLSAAITAPERDDIADAQRIVVTAPGSWLPELDTPESPKLAVQLHLYFTELADELLQAVNQIPYPYDCFISVDTAAKQVEMEALFTRCTAREVRIEVLPNQGRDIGPLLTQLAPVIDNYRYFAHAHTKRSQHMYLGDEWRRHLTAHTFGSPGYLQAVFAAFETDPQLGLAIPSLFERMIPAMGWDTTETDVARLLQRLNMNVALPRMPLFAAGDFFWGRTSALRPLFDLGLAPKDFGRERGQLRRTLAHVIERSWVYIAAGGGYHTVLFSNNLSHSQID
ncbi:MAG: rhamnan synthesis F family protein [Propionibacteriaceae bacterium]|jgi:lipopolysaccharide biosynthesis protein|nr:rhamnan synthesis F family protein [Propionibacteriaceae bacterium]